MSAKDADILLLAAVAERPRELGDRDDDELMRLVAVGHLPAFTELAQRYEGRVRRFCSRLSSSSAVGDEIAQEVFLDLWRGRGTYRREGTFAAFLFTIARRRCASAGRRMIDRVWVNEDAAEPPANDAVALDALIERERWREVEVEVARLSPKLREALAMRFSAGLSYEQIAEATGKPEVTARARVFQAVRRLRERLAGGKAS